MKKFQRIIAGVLLVVMLVGTIGIIDLTMTGKEDTKRTETAIVRGYGNVITQKEKKNNKIEKNQGNQKSKPWNQQMIQIESNVEPEKRIKVAILDSGINFSTDLNVIMRKNFIPGDDCSVLYEDPAGHGTAIAGIIAALDNEEGITGINPYVELYSARVLDARLEAPVDRIVEAIDWAIEQKVDIINMSFGIQNNIAELEQAIERADAAGILMVAAVGNGEEIAYPAAYDEVIAVGSLTAEGIPAENNVTGEALEIMAPGENILSTGIFGGVLGVSGTSFAVPHVVGAASVLMEKNPEMPASYVRALLNYSANLYGSKDMYGNGVVDLEYALHINEKFKRLYKKHMKKVEKNQKEKQMNKFWGEVLKVIPENEKAVEVFSGLESVEGLWGNVGSNAGHYDLINDGALQMQINSQNQVSFSNEQLAILTYASYFADHNVYLENMDKNPYHGYFQQKLSENGAKLSRPLLSNYIANYIFLTKVAMADGNAAQVSYSAMYSSDRTRIINDISTNGVGGMTWEQMFNQMNADRNTNISNTPQNIKLFLYGIAMHCATDIFAHSAWAKQENEGWSRVRHKDDYSCNADNPDYLSMRFSAAQEVAKNVLVKAYYGTEGYVTDFLLSGMYYGDFYLRNFSENVQSADSVRYNNAKANFDKADLDCHVSDYDTIK